MDSGCHSWFCDLLFRRHVLGSEWSWCWVRGIEADIKRTGDGVSMADVVFILHSGTQDTQLSDTANGVLYGCFAIAGFFAGSVNVRRPSTPLPAPPVAVRQRS